MNATRNTIGSKGYAPGAIGVILAGCLLAAAATRAEVVPVEHDHEAHEAHEAHDAEPGLHADGEEGAEHAELHGEEEDHSVHGAEAHGEEEGGLRLTAEQRKRFGIVVRPAEGGSLHNEVRLPGEILFNEDRVVHMVPRVEGIAREVLKSVGDPVEAGELLAVIDSRELADAKAEYLAARARSELADKYYAREKALYEKQVSSEQDYLEAEQALADARIERRSAEQKLHALGLPEGAIEALGSGHDEAITRYEIRSPIRGVVTERHISLGESLEADADIFTVVDTRSVWVNLTVYAKHLSSVRVGRDVVLRVEHSGVQARGNIVMVTPFVDQSTRSATARVVLDNSNGQWIPGTFVTGFIGVAENDLPVVVPRHAVQNIEGRDFVFVPHGERFEMTPVVTGSSDRDRVEIVAGLEPGTPYVAEGAFQLKATAVTRALGSHAGHGH